MFLAFNDLTFSDSNKVENIWRTFESLCCSLCIQTHFLRNFNPILNHLNFKTLYCTRHYLSALYLVNALENEITAGLSCCVESTATTAHPLWDYLYSLMCFRNIVSKCWRTNEKSRYEESSYGYWAPQDGSSALSIFYMKLLDINIFTWRVLIIENLESDIAFMLNDTQAWLE